MCANIPYGPTVFKYIRLFSICVYLILSQYWNYIHKKIVHAHTIGKHNEILCGSMNAIRWMWHCLFIFNFGKLDLLKLLTNFYVNDKIAEFQSKLAFLFPVSCEFTNFTCVFLFCYFRMLFFLLFSFSIVWNCQIYRRFEVS